MIADLKAVVVYLRKCCMYVGRGELHVCMIMIIGDDVRCRDREDRSPSKDRRSQTTHGYFDTYRCYDVDDGML